MEAERPRVGVDIGGTFTDVALVRDGELFSTKLLTTYAAPEAAIIDGITQVAGLAGIRMAGIGAVIHGTTLATNALIERRGARTAFITTSGFRDVIEMRTENRFELYDLDIVLPAALVPRKDRHVVHERIGAEGNVLRELDDAEVHRLAARIVQLGYESVAVGLMHSYVNPGHERRIRDILFQHRADLPVSLSSEVSPQMREFQRFNTVCANAYVKPLMASYLGRLAARLRGAGTDCPVFMIHSGGGIITLETAAEFPVRLLESGPAGGAIFAAGIAARHDLGRVLSYDMGGTTAKICLIEDGVPKTAKTFEVARTYRFKKGSGMPISIPVIEMVEIGAGGGSIASVDRMGQIRVGPQSAGSEPGPACYGRGGARPTVTDADLVLGRLDPDHFAGGTIVLSGSAAQDAIAEELAGKLGIAVQEAAFGLCEMVDETMSGAARMHGVENGADLAGYTMVAFGGAAPLHASRICEKLGISRCLVPPGAGVGSAIGFLQAPVAFEAVRSAYLRLGQFDPDKVNAVLAELTDEATRFVRAADPTAAIATECTIYVRYVGQGWEIPVAFDMRHYTGADAPGVMARFEEAYRRLFGRAITGLDAEIVSWSLRASAPVRRPAQVETVPAMQEALAPSRRTLFDTGVGAVSQAGVIGRDALASGMWVGGPAIIVERETTTIVSSTFDAIMQPDGCLLLRTKAARPGGAPA